MKNKYILIFFAVLSAVFSCAKVDESQLEGDNSTVEKVGMTFKAVIEKEADTKTVLDGNLGDNLRKVLWQPGDAIGVTSITFGSSWDVQYPEVSKFTSTLSSESETTEFDGRIVPDQMGYLYKAFYPYTETLKDSNNVFIFNMPAEQKYVKNSFDPNVAPMVATAKGGETFTFRNLFGVLAVQLKGEESVKSVTFSGNDSSNNRFFVAGNFRVDPYAEEPKADFYNSGLSSVTLNCETPVQLDPTAATAFYLVLPPATYDNFTIIVATEDGKVMIKNGTKPLTIKRADVVAAGALAYVETLPIDLSEHGTANSYIVDGAGLYTFDASVIGNGEYGIIEGVFHTDDPNIAPSKVELIWQDRAGVITSLNYNPTDKIVSFIASGQKGNAILAAKNDDDKIIWSWHMWFTDKPVVQLYENDRGTFNVLDRNLGAIRADRGVDYEWHDSRGLLYQWGRKDPFPQSGIYSNYRDSRLYLDEIIEEPRCFVRQDRWTFDDEWSPYFWSLDKKTVYDPCPVGYVVATSDIWDGFVLPGKDGVRLDQLNISGSFDYGWEFIINDHQETAWYPVTNVQWYYNYGIVDETTVGYMWAVKASGDATALEYYYNNSTDMAVSRNVNHSPGHGMTLRCMKDENHVDLSYPTVNISDITDVTKEAATIHVNVSNDGSSAVTSRGIIWGTQSGLTLESGNVISEPQDLHEFTAELSGLQQSTRYYVRAYATNGRGTGYSEETSFYTAFDGDSVNLSEKGTSNSYIVRPIYGEYYFDASVKGNSEESVGQIASVELLWETRNTANNIKAGSVVTYVELKGTDVHFQLPPDVKPGNAVIAVKDALGTILWSWHIWVVDFDPVETQQTYISGAVMMDRNLGALKVKGDVTANGLIYYWGRKDPFPSPVSYSEFAATAPANVVGYLNDYHEYEYSIQNPTTVISSGGWNDSYTNWGDSKTMYDPCPPGWKVPSHGAWDKIDYSGTTIPEPYSTPEAYYPPTGYVRGTEICEFNYYSYVYSSTSSESSNYAYLFRIPEYWTGPIDKDYGLAVRCMKDMSGVSGGGNDYVVDDEYEWEE